MGVARDLLRVQPEDAAAEEDRDHDRHRGAVRVPVADVAAHGGPDHNSVDAAPLTLQVEGASGVRTTIERMTVRVGIAGWIDKSLIDSKLFYPLNAKTSEERINFSASQCSL